MRLSDLAALAAGGMIVSFGLGLTGTARLIVDVTMGVAAGLWLSVFGDED